MRTVMLSLAGVFSLLVAGPGLAQEDRGAAESGADRAIWGPERPGRGGFDLDVLVGGRPLVQRGYGEERRVEVVAGSEYALRLTNPTSGRLAVAVSVDGLNVIDGRRSGLWDASKWVVHPRQTLTIDGWQVGSDRARRFYFTTERDSYAARIGRPGEFGIITAAFYRERRRAEVIKPRTAAPVPRESDRSTLSESFASSTSRGAAAGRDRDAAARQDRDFRWSGRERAATGIGRSLDSSVRVVDMELEVEPVAVVTIHYDFRRPRPWPEPLSFPRRGWSPGREDDRFAPEP